MSWGSNELEKITGDDLESIIANVEALKTVYRPASGIYSIKFDKNYRSETLQKTPTQSSPETDFRDESVQHFLALVSLECD
jgi:hypothetical protein